MAEIGSIGARPREVTGINPSVDQRAFGAGVASALNTLGGELAGLARTRASQDEANTSLSEAYKDRQRRISSAGLQADLIRLDNEMTRELSERYDAAEVGAPGFTDQTHAWAQSRLEEFRRRVPEELRPDFEARIETVLQSKTNTAFQLQVSAENAEFTKTIGDLQVQARDAILTAVISSPNQLDALEADWQDQFTELLKNSPMDKQATRDLAESLAVSLSSAKMVRLAQEESLDNVSLGGSVPGTLKTEGQRVYSDRPVAAGLSAAAVGFLNAIAGPESGGDYNVMYSPNGRRYFSDFSQHPNDPAVIGSGPYAGQMSSAAGRYQFLNSTWTRVARELGLTDFSPESQDRAAWHLARQDYFKRTGRDLEAVLTSGHQPSIAAARRMLIDTWEGLGNISDGDFIDAVASATGNPSSLIWDEEFSHIPLDQRFAIMADAQAGAEAIRAQMAAEAEARRNSQMESLRRGLFDGTAGMQEISLFAEQLRMSVDEQEEMLGLFEEHQAQVFNSERMLTSFEDPYFVFDSGNTEHKEMAEAFFAQSRVGERLANGDEEYVNSLMLPAVKANNGFIPSNVAGVLTQQMSSQNVQQAQFALSTLSKLLAEAPQGFDAAFDDQTVQDVAFFNAAQGSLPQEEILGYIRNQRDPMQASARKVAQEVYTEAIKDRPEDFNPQNIARELGARGGIPMLNAGPLAAEFHSTYMYQLSRLGDHRKARQATLEVLGTRYGVTRIGGTERLMKNPPEVIYGPFDGGTDWIEQQLLEEFPSLQGKRYELISDPVTEAQKRAGQPPTYRVVQFDDYGMPIPLNVTDHVNGRGGDPLMPVRWHPQVTDEMVMRVIERDSVPPAAFGVAPRDPSAPDLPGYGITLPTTDPEVNREPFWRGASQATPGVIPGIPGIERDPNVSIPGYDPRRPAETVFNTPRADGRPRSYNQWRKLSTAEKKRFGLDITRLEAIRYFGLRPFSNLPEEDR